MDREVENVKFDMVDMFFFMDNNIFIVVLIGVCNRDRY